MSPNYQTRPSKHVERKIFVDTFQHLRAAGYDIPTYHYLGFGAPYYMDFILFHRLLSIKKMTCLESNAGIAKRMKFNKPFKFIELQMQDIITYLPSVSNRKQYIVWLDYESQLNSEVLSCIGSLVATLMNGSILIVTVNADSRLVSEENSEAGNNIVAVNQKRYQEQLEPYCGEVATTDITRNGLPPLFVRSIKSRIADALRSRPDDDFHQIFNYLYRDGAKMLTFGGVIDRKENARKIATALRGLNCINRGNVPKSITIPPLTMREKLLLDQKITRLRKAGRLPFELDPNEIRGYIEYANYYPTFHEVFMN